MLDHRLAFHTVLLSEYLLLKTAVNSVVMYRKGVCCMFSMHSHQPTEDHKPSGFTLSIGGGGGVYPAGSSSRGVGSVNGSFVGGIGISMARVPHTPYCT